MLISEAISYANKLGKHAEENAYLVIDDMEKFTQFVQVSKYALDQLKKQGVY